MLNHGRDDATVICFHPLGGDLLAYRPLVALLGMSATVYGVQSRALRDPETELVTARALLERLRSPRDPS